MMVWADLIGNIDLSITCDRLDRHHLGDLVLLLVAWQDLVWKGLAGFERPSLDNKLLR